MCMLVNRELWRESRCITVHGWAMNVAYLWVQVTLVIKVILMRLERRLIRESEIKKGVLKRALDTAGPGIEMLAVICSQYWSLNFDCLAVIDASRLDFDGPFVTKDSEFDQLIRVKVVGALWGDSGL